VLSVLSEKNSKRTHDYLVNKLKVDVLLNSAISDVSDAGFKSGERFISTATLIWACGVCAVDDVAKLDIEKINGRRLKVDEYCETIHKNVFAVGDISGFKGTREIPFPAMVENAIQTAHGVAVNIINDLRGKPREKVEVKMHGVMVSVGNYFAVSDIMGREFGKVMSILMKFIVNIHYLWEITGFYGIAKYLYHEILERRQNKNIVEQHYSVRNQTWWLVPARMFLGAIWMYEGIKKIGDGWLSSGKLNGFFGGADSFYEKFLNPGSSDAVSGATGAASGAYSDAVSAATAAASSVASAVSGASGGTGEAAEQASNILMNWDWGWIHFIAVKAEEIAFKIDFYPMTWIRDNWLLANNGTQMFFQWFVVLAEIIVGLCLIGGAFNFIASGFSIILLASFLMTTGLYMQSQWWMLFLSFALMAGAGRAFGLDYYLIPYLNNFWERIWKSKKWCPIFRRALDRYQK
ncbi:MAG: FAD-dependent oxidoreductase, partial [Saccharofermentanales bacterium]